MPRIANWLKNTFKKGDPVRAVPDAEWCNRVANILQDIRGIGCRIEKPTDANGFNWCIIVDGSSDGDPTTGYEPPWDGGGDTGYDGLFELTSVGTTNFEITDTQKATGTMVRMGGKDEIKTINAGSGMLFDTDHWQASAALTGDTYIYLLTTSDTAASIVRATTMPDVSSGGYDYIPLWFLPWDGVESEIDTDSIVDLRTGHYRLPDRSGASQYQVLALDSNQRPAWDWPRFHV